MLNVLNFLNPTDLSEELNFLQNSLLQTLISTLKNHPIVYAITTITEVASLASIIPNYLGKKLPPGPIGPFFRNVRKIDLEINLSDIREKYGQLSSFFVGNR